MNEVFFTFNRVVLICLIFWIFIGIFWLFPKKNKLLKKHGFDKSNDFFVKLAKNGDLDAKDLVKNTKLFVAFGVIFMIVIFVFKGVMR